MAIVHESSATASGTGTSITLTKPTGVAAGDVLVASFFHESVTITAAPTGWTRFVDGSGGTSVSAYWKVATGSEPASYTWTQTGASSTWRGGISRFSGVDNTTPIDVTAAQTSTFDGTTVVFPGVTTATANAMVLGSVSSATGTATASTPPGALTERWDANGVELASAIQAAAGSTGSLTWTFSSNANGGWLSALRPGGPSIIFSTGIASVESVGLPAVTPASAVPIVFGTGVASAESVGSLTLSQVSSGTQPIVFGTGVPSAEHVGSPAVTMGSTILEVKVRHRGATDVRVRDYPIGS